MNAMITILIASLCLHSVLASPVAEQNENKYTEAINDVSRTTYSSGGSLYLGLNSTLLWLAVFGLGALALLVYVFGLSTLLGEGASNTYGYNQRYSNYYDPDLHAANSPTAQAALAYAQAAQAAQHAGNARAKRAIDENMVTKMLQLEQIFKKYEVEEDECRAYIACEAANVERLAENGPIVQKTHELFNAINYAKPEHLAKLNASKGMMIMKQAYDSAKARQHEVDVCAPLRDACSALRQQKKN